MNKTVLALRHVHFEDLGVLAPLFQERGFEIRYMDPLLQNLDEVDAAAPDVMVVLGGPIGAYDDATYPFLASEFRLIQRRLSGHLPVLGICLGAQLIARALGGSVAPMGHKEIGYGPLSLTEAGANSVLAPLGGVAVLHWHGDMFTAPVGAEMLASTVSCRNQAFSLGDKVLSLQFHLEADADCIEHWLVGHASELTKAAIPVQQLREDAKRFGPALSVAARQVVGAWLDKACRQAHR
ncbi:glutamine amidotransferase [Achromobacter kerstersii]|jgi:GMP synthase (glutamine-hydrolysing)|uniref:glutamine amidotransferase n=1 Tax=Achromobacter kerstersii TaxID=1353890 RepID=UPI003D06CB0E